MPVSPCLIFLSVFITSAQFTALAQPSATGMGPENKIFRLRRADGMPCLSFMSNSKSDAIINRNFHHYVSIENRCSQAITVTICYKNDDSSCQQLRISAYSSDETMLGTMAGEPNFDFDYREHY